MSLFKKKSNSSTSSLTSVSTMGSKLSQKNPFCKFDEKKDYDRRCHMKHPAEKKAAPCLISFCLGKKF